MSLGSSKSYKQILKLLINEDELNMQGFLDYFQPLYNWLYMANRRNGVEIGWEKSQCKSLWNL